LETPRLFSEKIHPSLKKRGFISNLRRIVLDFIIETSMTFISKKDFARELRKNMTLAEVLLWKELKSKQLLGLKFIRQKVQGKYILDFYCSELKIAIEVDGSTHDFRIEKDIIRDQYLNSVNIKVIRILDSQIKQNLSDTLEWLTIELFK
jgi:very-short-patch-repair endonuclease